MPRAVSPKPAPRRARLGEGGAGCLLGPGSTWLQQELWDCGRRVGVVDGGSCMCCCPRQHAAWENAAGPCKCDAHLHSFL